MGLAIRRANRTHNRDQYAGADEAGNQVADPSAEMDAHDTQYGARDRRANDAEHDVHEEPHVALHELLCQPTGDRTDDDCGNPAYSRPSARLLELSAHSAPVSSIIRYDSWRARRKAV